ncbi:hypothetical protein [Microbacterium enclense]|uniref:hypothetical protein n=1 Tax=Microbacterium enclense TaxID=993073 RepID=UPI003F7D7D8A
MTTTRTSAHEAEKRIDEQITGIALMALQASGGADYFEVENPERKTRSDYGTGFLVEQDPVDRTDPVFLARRQILFMLLDPELDLIGSAVRKHQGMQNDLVLEQAATRLAEQLEWQVMRPRETGGLDLHQAASTTTSVVGWARKFLVGPFGARKTIQRIVEGIRTRSFGEEEDFPAPEDEVDMEGAERARRAVISYERITRRLPAGSVARAQADAAMIHGFYDLPPLNPDLLDDATAAVIAEMVYDDPNLPLRSLSEHALGVKTPTSHRALVRLWSDWTIAHARTLLELEHPDLMASIVVGAVVRSALEAR